MHRAINMPEAQAIVTVQNRRDSQVPSLSEHVAEHVGYLSTGFTELDALLGGGIPCGRITTIVGDAISGRRTLALHMLAKAQGSDQLTAYIDMEHAFDPQYAVLCGVDLAHVLVVRPDYNREALLTLQALVITGEVKAVIIDNMDAFGHEPRAAQRFIDTLCRLLSPLHATRCTLICLGSSADSAADKQQDDALGHLATVRLQLAQEQWLQEYQGWCYQAQLSVLRQKRPSAFTSMLLTIPIPAL